ncbi:MAG: sigma-70 family RNA polymerase sigma factor [Bryobacteraceae bacterium]
MSCAFRYLAEIPSTRGRMAAAATAQVARPAGFGHGAAMGWVWPRPVEERSGHGLDADVQLVERCLAGDDTAWEDMVKVHTRRVYAICYRFTGSDAEAQDLTQEVFLRVFRTLKSFRAGEGSFVVWMARVARNLLIDHYRRTRVERATGSIEDQLPLLEEKSAIAGRADGLLAGREASELLQAGLQKLSPELRETVILRDLEELEYREIAQVLGVPEGTVKSRLNRGRAELGKVLRRNAAAGS